MTKRLEQILKARASELLLGAQRKEAFTALVEAAVGRTLIEVQRCMSKARVEKELYELGKKKGREEKEKEIRYFGEIPL